MFPRVGKSTICNKSSSSEKECNLMLLAPKAFFSAQTNAPKAKINSEKGKKKKINKKKAKRE